MSWLTKLTQVAAGRTQPGWKWRRMYEGMDCRMLEGGRGYMFAQVDDDQSGKFIEVAENCFDELVAVAQIADNIWHSGLLDKPETKHIDDLLEKSLIALRQKVQGLPPELATEGKGEGG